MELELGRPVPDGEEFMGLFEAKCSIIDKGCSTDHLGYLNNKRRHEQGVTKIKQHSSGTSHSSLSLLNKGDDEEDDHHRGKRKKTSCSTSMHVADDDKVENVDHVIGWPPIRSWRMKMLQQIVRRHGHVYLGQGS